MTGKRGGVLWHCLLLFLWPWVWADGLQLGSVDVPPERNSPDSLSAYHFDVPLPQQYLFRSSTCRFGEADHPGPDGQMLEPADRALPIENPSLLRIGCSNPGGLRGKELTALQLGCGIWCYAETHLTHGLQRAVTTSLSRTGSQMNRQIKAHFGAPVAFRSNSVEAGTWSGVGVLSDFPSRELNVAWQHGERSSGRVLITRHLINQLPFLVAACYGFPSGPTWPNSRQLTGQLLSSLTREMVISGSGPRIIAGDFNSAIHQQDEFRIWESYGWTEAQVHANTCWHRPIQPTCKKATVVDMIWMSPEAAMLCRNVDNIDIFADHTTLYADFAVPTFISNISTWPKPTQIPWDQIDLELWHNKLRDPPAPDYVDGSSTNYFTEWAQHWERALDGCVLQQPAGRLPEACKGRAVRTKPQAASLTPPVVKASRPGEVQLRSDLVSKQVHLWFKQLRRLQSYKHAALANKLTVDAEAYRLNLWMAIRKSRGFDGLFDSWWTRRLHQSSMAPSSLPLAPPDGPTAELIFTDFKTNFESFERWHLRQRRKLLQTKYDRCCHRLFRELRPPQREQLDLLWHTSDFTILALDFSGCQLHVDQPVQELEGRVWFINHVQVEVVSADGDLLVLRSLPSHAEPGDILQCHQYYSSTEQIHQALIDLWRPRWQTASMIGSEQWNRITGFIHAYLPRLDFPEPDLTHSQWQTTLNQFPPRPARGVDGIDVKDLKQLPEQSSNSLLTFIKKIDGDTCVWPDQLLFGTVLSLSKQELSHLPNHFRPVVILGTVYRAWSRMCALPLLQLLSMVVPASAHGFLPGRECAQIWLQLQCFIEVCIQQGIEFSGFSTDIEKCFNNIGRDPLMTLASHVGLCPKLLQPWRSFLDNFVRSFQVRTTLSAPVRSSQGLPEGCSLSVVGMVLIDWALHGYLSALAPSVHAFSYVDNVSEAGHKVMDVVSAFFSTICFFQLWGLALDFAKTYFWSTSASSRALLRLLGLSIQSDALELGGSMTFEASRRNRQLRARGDKLHAKWERLRKSACPLEQKFAVLPMAFWASALYGNASCPLADSYHHQLRQAANKALRCNQAGSNALLRFSLNDKMESDPGFFHVLSVLQTFRRVCGRSPRILDCWRLWMQSFDGKITNGPFGVLLDTLNKIGWSVGLPPIIVDRQGLSHDLLQTPWMLLRHLLKDSWLCYVATTLQRPSMLALNDMDEYVVKWHNHKLTALERSLQSALQSGTFLDAKSHSKYDVTKDGFCSVCFCPQTHEHLLTCKKYVDLRETFSLTDELDGLPRAFVLHLLCPRSPWVEALRTYYTELEDTTGVFHSGPMGDEVQHLFTDGSHREDGRFETKRAAWGLYNATSQSPIAAGWLAGLPQTIARAELSAVIAALRWVQHWKRATHIWLDALEIHRGLQKRLAGYVTKHAEANADLWLVVDELLLDDLAGLIGSTWIPSHLCISDCESPFEEWVAINNGHADSLAVRCNEERSSAFQELLLFQKKWDECFTGLFERLRKYYFSIFERIQTDTSNTPCVRVDCSEDESDSVLYSFLDVLSSTLDPLHFVHTLGFPVEFLQHVLDWLRSHEDDMGVPASVSYLEVTFGLLKVDSVLFPFRNPMNGCWTMCDRRSLFVRPTLTHFYGIVRKMFRYLCRHWCEISPACSGLNRSSLGVYTPLDGINLRLKPDVLASVQSALANFTRARPIRKACDLARPVA